MSIKLLFIIGLSLDLVGAMILVLFSPFVPWSIRTWKGESAEEKAWERRASILLRVGLSLLVAGFFLQLLGYFFNQ